MSRLLDEFEQLLEHTLEDELFSWLPVNTPIQDTLYQILSVVASAQESTSDAILHGDFMIQVSQEDYPIWFANQVDLVNFSRTLMALCKKSGYHLDKPPAFHIMADPTQSSGSIEIAHIAPPEDASETQYLGSSTNYEKRQVFKSAPQAEVHAYLTNSDNEIFQLLKPVTNIGRREDNDIVLQDQKVSRQHAQIRRSHQHYLIFDLNSTGGTWVNNTRITQATLTSGDVISFAGVLLIYAEEVTVLEEEQTNDLNGTTSTPAIDKTDMSEEEQL